ncbi:glycine cleavage system protein GcvH [Carnobacterium viridans]|uniref:Glycine cleavage system H protein n=1 Tax=Carnobacterium viridans TaxID=174587 RepID=A0A1H0YSA2_9LACT|nr:glycine cleavage system protein GcvH [Carnobacterium viridans]UDE94975.1 glycine cleavage system protein GcvH [Carnobacterium viridans]SDQ18000.1 glycine cleavage system H protein [Carnobacterium viridans]
MTEDRLYSKEHEWILPLGEDVVRVGITDYAVKQLGDVVYVEVPEVDAEVSVGSEMGTVESIKSASEIFAPVTGIILAVNEELEDAPELVNASPFEGGWFAEIQLENPVELEGLLNEENYHAYVAELAIEEEA